MRKTTLTVIACALMLAAFPPSVGADVTPNLLVVSTGTPSLDHAGLYEEFDCDGQLALLVTDLPGCGDFGGEHTVGGFGYIIVGFRTIDAGNAGPIPLTGTVQALLEHAGGSVDFQCTWDAGVFAGCQIISAVWPAVGATFEYSCQSTAGALGMWGECYVGHE